MAETIRIMTNMRRILYFVACVGLLAGCSQMEQDIADVNSLCDGDLVEKVIFEVLPIKDGDNPDTKASAVPAGGTVSFAWEVTDTVGIFPKKGSQVFFSMESGAGTSSANFDGGDWALKQGSLYISYYPLVGEFYLDRTKIPVSFAGQKQMGTSSPFHGARYYLATEPTSSENGVLRFSYKTLNTIINVNATLPAGTYTKMSLTIEEPLFVEEGTYSLDERTIVGTEFTNKLEIELEDVVLTTDGTIPIYIMSAPVDLKGKEVTVRIISSEGQHYECIKTPSKVYEAGTRYGLTCDNMVQSNVVFDDEIFKAYCVENFDSDGDGEVSYAEAKVVTYIDVSQQGISSLKGIEHFINLTWLSCYDNQLTSLDVSQNTALKQLACDYNQLTSLDVSKNNDIEYLHCYNNQLTSLDVSKNTALISLHCGSNQLTSLDVSKNTALGSLFCSNNQLPSRDVGQNTALTSLSCDGNQLASLDVSQNTALKQLACDHNQLTSLDVSQNTALERLNCYFNQLTSLDVSKNTALISLHCGSNQLTSLDVSHNTALTELLCHSNQLTSLDVSRNTALISLDCGYNQLTSLDVSRNTVLTSLSCNSNQLTSLDVSQNTVLTSLYCDSNQLASLDVSQNTLLKALWCYNNPLTEIWMKTGQTIGEFEYDTDVTTIKYKD